MLFWDVRHLCEMARTPNKELSPQQLAYLAMLVDPEEVRPKLRLAEELGVEPSALSRWEKTPLFRKAWRAAVVADITKPKHLLEMAERIRVLATSKTVDPKTQLQAADLFVKLSERLTPEDEARPIEDADDDALIAQLGEDHPAAKVLLLKKAAGGG